jgi:hypothetical protein
MLRGSLRTITAIRPLAALGEILTVLGPIGILGLWLYQQVEIEQRASELRKITSARNIFLAYQSHNAIFNAIIEIVGKNEKAQEQIRRFQLYNYELGLGAIEQALSTSEKSNVPAPVFAYLGDVPKLMDQIQVRIVALQTRLSKKETEIQSASEAANARYLWMYIAISVISICGSLLKVFGKISTT